MAVPYSPALMMAAVLAAATATGVPGPVPIMIMMMVLGGEIRIVRVHQAGRSVRRWGRPIVCMCDIRHTPVVRVDRAERYLGRGIGIPSLSRLRSYERSAAVVVVCSMGIMRDMRIMHTIQPIPERTVLAFY